MAYSSVASIKFGSKPPFSALALNVRQRPITFRRLAKVHNFAPFAYCELPTIRSTHAAPAANDRKVRTAVTRPSKMLRAARKAGLVKLRRGIGRIGQWLLWAESGSQE